MKKVGIDFFTKVNFISQLQSKGNYLSYVISTANEGENKYNSSIYLYDLLQKKHRRLTTGKHDQGYIWLNEDEIIFRAKRDENKDKVPETIFYKINILGGEAESFIKLPFQVGKIKKLDDNNFIFIAPYIEALDKVKDLEGHDKDDYIKSLKEEDDYEVIEEIPFWSNGGTYTKGKRNALYLYNQSTNKTVKLTEDKFHTLDFTYESEFKQVFVSGKTIEGMSTIFNKLYKLDLDKKALIDISPVEKYSYRKWIQVSEDELIVYGTDSKVYGLNENGKFNLLNLRTGDYKLLTPDFVHSTGSAIGSDLRIGNAPSPFCKDGSDLFFTKLDGFTNKLMRLNKNGEISVELDTEACIDEYICVDGQFYGICLYKNAPQEIYSLEDMKPISSYNQELIETHSIMTPEHFEFVNRDGIAIDGFVIKPVDFEMGKKYPMILDIHGGPKSAYGDILYHEMQYWANEGYVVTFCNPRGSDGKENAFADIRGKYGTIDYNDIMDFTDEVLKRYDYVDAEKLGVTGGSYGGFMTNWIIGHTNRFKAAASQRSISNWVGFFGTSDIGYFFASDQVAATPWSNADLMWEQSPLKYADKAVTPTLFIHSQEDYRCWTPEAYQMFTALKYHSVPSRLVMFSGENHELSRSGKPKHRIRRLNEITKWMDKYLK